MPDLVNPEATNPEATVDAPAVDTPAPAVDAPEVDAPAAKYTPSEEVMHMMQEGWRDFIPEELRERNEWSRVNSFQDLCKNYIEGQQTISKSVRIPDATSTVEDINAFYAKLGKPASKADYTFEYTPQEGQTIGKEAYDFTVFQEIADKANLTKDQYQALATAYLDIQNSNAKFYQEQMNQVAGNEVLKAEAELRREWGKDYQTNLNNISAKIGQMYPEETLKRMEMSGLFRDTNFLKSQLRLTKMMTGDTIYLDGVGIEDVPQTLDNLRAQRDSLMQSDYAKNKPQVDELNKRIVQLQMAQSNHLGNR